MLFSRYKYDVFISHAVEDKLAIANDLCKRLEEAGLSVWYSGRGLRVGDSIEEVIFENLPQSRFAVVIFSQHYLAKNWTMKEYYYLQTQERQKRKIILPILYDVTVNDLKEKDILMADKFALPFTKGMDVIVEQLVEEVKGVKTPSPAVHRNLLRRRWSVIGLALLLALVTWAGYSFFIKHQTPGTALLTLTVQQRIEDQQKKMENELQQISGSLAQPPLTLKEITDVFTIHTNVKSNYRNEYAFTNGYREIKFKKNVETALQIDMDAYTPLRAYGFQQYSLQSTPAATHGNFSFTFTNLEPVTFTTGNYQKLDNGDYQVTVTYSQNLRGIHTNLVFPDENSPKRHQLYLYGLLPSETYTFRKVNNKWTWIALD